MPSFKKTFTSGAEYDGEWNNNTPYGKGKLYFKDKLKYDGE